MTITEDAAAALAVLTYALDEPTTDLADSLRRLTLETATAVTSYLGLSVVVAQNDPPLTITATADGGLVGPIRASLHIWLSGRGQAPEPVGIALILYAGAPGAYVDLAADLAWRTGRPRPRSRSTSTSPSPPLSTSPTDYARRLTSIRRSEYSSDAATPQNKPAATSTAMPPTTEPTGIPPPDRSSTGWEWSSVVEVPVNDRVGDRARTEPGPEALQDRWSDTRRWRCPAESTGPGARRIRALTV
ncbi:hypothetical protein [Tsukamurella soli]|uniref:hypothetical protein n=1 Tax=Tsukamurella soli TaxID=644556 RepID=UPI0036149091